MAEELAVQEADTVSHAPAVAGFSSSQNFELMQRMAKALCSSDLVPKEYRGNIPNTMIALEIAHRLGASPLSVMQNLYIVQGKPGWSSQFIIAAVNSTNKFSPLRFEEDEKDGGRTRAWAAEKATGEKLYGPWVSLVMAKAEGWLDKAGSKWKTMPELMRKYRAAAFFGRLYAPEVLMGIQTAEEVVDVTPIEAVGAKVIMERFARPVIPSESLPIEKIDIIPEFISQDKIEILNAMLKSNKKDLKEFLVWAGKESIADLVIGEYPDAVAWIEKD